MKRLFVIMFGVILFNVTLSQSPLGFNYQAVVRNENGIPIAEQEVSIIITIWNELDEANYYSELHTLVTSKNGVISAVIGTGSELEGSFNEIPWENFDVSVKVEVQMQENAGFTNMGSTKIQAIPYALYALGGSLDNLIQGVTGQTIRHNGTGWETSSTLYNNGTNIGIGTSMPPAKLTISGLGNNPSIPSNSSTGILAIRNSSNEGIDLGKLSSFPYTGWLQSGYNGNVHDPFTLQPLGGNVGIGVANPTERLEVMGNIKTHGKVFADGLEVSIQESQEEDPIFVVNNSEGQVVFAVYETGVRMYVDDNPNSTKGNKSGFAIGGFTGQKNNDKEYFRVTPDSVRVYLREPTDKSNKGGFAIGGFTGQKQNPTSLMHLTHENYFIGHQSGESITTGTKNTFFGYLSGVNTTSGIANIFIGEESGYNTTEGKRNIFIGYQAGKSNIGQFSHNTIGHDNIYIGGQAGRNNENGEHNTFVGSQSGIFSAGTKNTFFGAFTGLYSSGTANVFLGLDAGRENNEGNNNVFVGTIAGMRNSGENNTFIGYAAGWTSSASNGSGNVFIGRYAGLNETGSNKLYIANSTGTPLIYGDFSSNFVGIGTKNPSQSLTVNGNIRIEGADRWLYFNGGHGVIKIDDIDKHLWFDVGNSYRLVIRDNGRVGIGVNNPSYRLDLPNIASVEGQARSNSWVTYSDRRIKSNLTEIPYGLKEVMRLNPKAYLHHSSSSEENTIKIENSGSLTIGLIAQEVFDIIPEVVAKPNDENIDLWGISYEKIVPVLIKAIQEQQETILYQQETIDMLVKEIHNIKALINK